MNIESKILPEIAVRIKKSLKLKRLNQGDLAKYVGKDQAEISRYLNGKTKYPVDFLFYSANFLGVPVKYLLTGEGSPDLPQEAETAADAGDGSDQGQNALKHGSGHSGIDKANRVNVNLANSKTTRGDEMSVEDKDILIKYLKNDVSRLKKQVSDLEAEVLKLREKQREPQTNRLAEAAERGRGGGKIIYLEKLQEGRA